MDVGILQNLINHASQPQKSVSIRTGQVLNGKVIKLYPDQIAEVLIGGQRIIAQLEAPLEANGRYWFQVQSGEGKVHLKVLASVSEEAKQKENLGQILSSFSLPATKENIELVRFLMKEQLPITQEILRVGIQLVMDSKDKGAGLETLKLLLSNEFPLTKAIYQSLYVHHTESSTTELMLNLKTSINEWGTSTKSGEHVKELLNRIIPEQPVEITNRVLDATVKEWLLSRDEKNPHAFKLLQDLGVFSHEDTEMETLIPIMDKVLSSSKLPSEKNALQKDLDLLHKSIRKINFELVENQSDFVGKPEKSTLAGDRLEEAIQIANKYLSEAKGNLSVKNEGSFELIHSFKRIVLELSGIMDRKESAIKETLHILGLNKNMGNIERLLAESSFPTKDLNSEQTAMKIKEFFFILGLSHEHQVVEYLQSSKTELDQEYDALKPGLIKLINENPPSAVKDTAETLLQKLTAFQLLSQETGPIQQVIVQVPFFISGQMNELTMQWSGKKTQEGNIDPDFCRVLFYVNLENLGDTIIDMQIQNRIVSLQVVSEKTELKLIANQTIPKLKENLAKIKYHLSSVQFTEPETTSERKKQLIEISAQHEYNKVDFKI